jgi:hypothetical protein
LLRVTDPRSGKTPEGAQGTDAPYRPNDFCVIGSRPFCTVKHSITRYRITLEAYRAEMIYGTRGTGPSDGRWLTLAELDGLAFTSAHRKILERLAERGTRGDKKPRDLRRKIK